MAESLERGKVQEPGKQQEYFGFIVRECRRLSNLIGNVLDFSRIDQGRKRYEFEETDVRTLVEQTVKVMEPTADERGVHLVCVHPAVTDAAADCATIDGHAIQQALVNLIDNAIKHSPKGETVTIGWELHSRARSPSMSCLPHETSAGSGGARSPSAPGMSCAPRGGSAVGVDGCPTARSASAPCLKEATALSLWVEDHGSGIPADEHERIFERFYRCGSELRRETQGVGIGLSIVKHIVEAHGGTVSVRSAPGQGSRFTIELPCNAS
jgi:signal transduction histidine kinase